jgi:hypothetical protein
MAAPTVNTRKKVPINSTAYFDPSRRAEVIAISVSAVFVSAERNSVEVTMSRLLESVWWTPLRIARPDADVVGADAHTRCPPTPLPVYLPAAIRPDYARIRSVASRASEEVEPR